MLVAGISVLTAPSWRSSTAKQIRHQRDEAGQVANLCRLHMEAHRSSNGLLLSQSESEENSIIFSNCSKLFQLFHVELESLRRWQRYESRHEYYFQTGSLLDGEIEWRRQQIDEFLRDYNSDEVGGNWDWPGEVEFHRRFGDDVLSLFLRS